MLKNSFDNLGLIDDNNKHYDYSIKQGKELMNYNFLNFTQDACNIKRIKNYNNTEVHSIIEGMDNDDSTQSAQDFSTQSINNNSLYTSIENNFNKTLTEYSKTSDLVNKMILNNKNESKKIPQELWDKLKNLNEQLTSLSNKLTNELDNLVINNKKYYYTSDYKNTTNKHLNNLENNKKKLHDLGKNHNTILAMKQNSELKMKSTWLHYTGWLILSIIVVCVLIHSTLSNRISNITILILFIATIIGLYYIYNIIKI